MKDRIKQAGFWAGLISAVFLILGAFGVEVGDQTATTVVNVVCSLLVVLGIVTPTPGIAESTDCGGEGSEQADKNSENSAQTDGGKTNDKAE